jgi:hypothetical protein
MPTVNPRLLALETTKEIQAEVFGARPSDVREMIRRRLEVRRWPERFCATSSARRMKKQVPVPRYLAQYDRNYFICALAVRTCMWQNPIISEALSYLWAGKDRCHSYWILESFRPSRG